jgi:hypothetical protein
MFHRAAHVGVRQALVEFVAVWGNFMMDKNHLSEVTYAFAEELSQIKTGYEEAERAFQWLMENIAY